jgi:protein-tyrosine kinase
MSRIEKALEKAMQMRSEGLPTAEEQKNDQAAAQPSTRTTSRVVSIDAANRLLPTINAPNSVVSEQFRKLRNCLVRTTNEGKLHNLIMVTSSIPGEGKSLTAVNLAVSMAQEFDLTVLLIDADLRKPTVHKLLGFESSLGMADCLLEGADIADVIIKTDIDKLSVIPAGRVVEKPLELFTSKKMQDFMLEIKRRYNDRYVIIDTSPLLPFAETRSLAHLVDGIVFVIHEGVTQQKSILEAKELLNGCPMLGVVLNDSTSCKKEHDHYSGYYYSRPGTQG